MLKGLAASSLPTSEEPAPPDRDVHGRWRGSPGAGLGRRAIAEDHCRLPAFGLPELGAGPRFRRPSGSPVPRRAGPSHRGQRCFPRAARASRSGRSPWGRRMSPGGRPAGRTGGALPPVTSRAPAASTSARRARHCSRWAVGGQFLGSSLAAPAVLRCNLGRGVRDGERGSGGFSPALPRATGARAPDQACPCRARARCAKALATRRRAVPPPRPAAAGARPGPLRPGARGHGPRGQAVCGQCLGTRPCRSRRRCRPASGSPASASAMA
jgi:hypothetical protein